VKIDGAANIPEKNIANARARRLSKVSEEPKATIQQPQDSTEGPVILSKFKSFDRLEIVKKLIDAAPRVLVDCKNHPPWEETPFLARFSFQVEEDPKPEDDGEVEKWRQRIIENDPILFYMRKYIIEEFDREDAMTALYKVGDGKINPKLQTIREIKTDQMFGMTRAGIGI
jgi:hypothetical protein